jgi:cytoskeletal protein CcmA (bactofilin family)
VSYFSSKNERDTKPAPTIKVETPKPVSTDVSTIGAGMQVTGDIVCTGALQIFGRVTGDIHASQLAIREGAQVHGKIIAPDAVIEGAFHGSIHANSVKLQKAAVVEGEIFNKSLAIEGDARFEGVSRRLERAVESPSAVQSAPATTSNVQPINAGVTPLAIAR